MCVRRSMEVFGSMGSEKCVREEGGREGIYW